MYSYFSDMFMYTKYGNICEEIICKPNTAIDSQALPYISTHENVPVRVLNIRRLKILDTQPRVILPCIV